MKKFLSLIFLLVVVIAAGGCTHLLEIPKVIWGSSIKGLETARSEAAAKTVRCNLDECFAAVINLTKKDDIVIPSRGKLLDLFAKNRDKQYIVLMGVPGSVNTTEIGVFFTDTENESVLIEVTSLSTNAKMNAAEIIFEELSKIYQIVE